MRFVLLRLMHEIVKQNTHKTGNSLDYLVH